MLEKFMVSQLMSALVGPMVGPMVGSGLLSGGGKKMYASSDSTQSLILFVVLLVFLLIRAYILQLSYNYIVPRLMNRYSEKAVVTRELSYFEALILLIFANTLVGR